MSNPKDILKKAVAGSDCSKMCELVQRTFTTRNLLHFAHLSTKSYAAHMALGSLYDDIVEKVDGIAETMQGKFGLLEGLSQPASSMPSDIVKHVEEEMEWMCDNKPAISRGFAPVTNLLDDLEGTYSQTLYRLKNLS
jgi:hypothetical protein